MRRLLQLLTDLREDLEDKWYRFSCRYFHPYNRVTVSTLPPTFVDRDELLLHVAFQVLVDFVEGEKPFARRDIPKHQRRRQRKFGKLYYWWTRTRPARVSALSKVVVPKDPFGQRDPNDPLEITWKKACHEHYRQEKQWLAEDQAMFRRLIHIRPYMWT